MSKSKWMKLVMVGLLAAPLALMGCGSDGSDGAQGPPGPAGPPGDSGVPGDPGDPATRTANETCSVCHDPGRLVDMTVFHDAAVMDLRNDLQVVITNVTFPIAAPIQPVVEFSVTLNGLPFDGLLANQAQWMVAKLVPGTLGEADVWQSYVNRVRAGVPGFGPGGSPAIAEEVAQATTEGGGTGVFVNLGAGNYQYTFSTDLSTAAIPFTDKAPVVVGYEPTFTHRVGIQFAANIAPDVRENVWFDAVPDGSPITVTRNIATTASCLECHTRSALPPTFAFHSGANRRVEVEYCVLCHNPGTTDPESGELVDMAVMTHKIHRGKNLPTVAAGGSYIIWGNNNSVHDYSHVGYPQDIRNCTKCHTAADAATPDGDNWMTKPTIRTCTSCHDDISFVSPAPAGKRLHTAGAFADNSACTICHPATGGLAGVADVHQIPGRAEAAAFQFNVHTVVNTAPGEFPSVTFSVTDPTNADAPYNILTDAPFLVGGGASRLFVLIGWMNGEGTADWTNTGAGSTPAQPVGINALAAGVATDNGDGTFTVTSPVAIPLDAEGTGIAALEGHPALADGTRLPVTNAFLYFPITDGVAVPRREVVDLVRCDMCHDQLSIHGANRTDSIEVCVICHNPNATDINRRPADPALTTDGKVEESIDFKRMIHGIHASGEGGGDPRTTPLVIYGFGNTEHNFAEVTYPGNMRQCTQCHLPGTWHLPLEPGVLATTIDTGPDKASPNDDLNITKTAAVCSACHDHPLHVGHMQAQGASFEVLDGNILE